jgi:hypothetical protein
VWPQLDVLCLLLLQDHLLAPASIRQLAPVLAQARVHTALPCTRSCSVDDTIDMDQQVRDMLSSIECACNKIAQQSVKLMLLIVYQLDLQHSTQVHTQGSNVFP